MLVSQLRNHLIESTGTAGFQLSQNKKWGLEPFGNAGFEQHKMVFCMAKLESTTNHWEATSQIVDLTHDH